MYLEVTESNFEPTIKNITALLKKEQIKFFINKNLIAVVGPLPKTLNSIISKNRNIKIKVGNGVPLLASRDFHPQNSVVETLHNTIGDGSFVIMGGPCSVESEEHIFKMAKLIKDAGATVLRGGAFKPRTSPYSFQGLGKAGLIYLRRAADTYGLDVITEVMDETTLPFVAKYTDILQVGARNMQNFSLLKAIGKLDTPVALKRGMSATIDDLLNASEYIASGGNRKIILVERGIRTFDNKYTRNTFDISAVSVLKKLTHYPVILDPSHAIGASDLVPELMLTSAATSADGEIVEVHNNPKEAFSDGQQAVLPEKFAQTVKKAIQIHNLYMKQ